RSKRDWSSDVCSSDLVEGLTVEGDILTATVEGVIPGSYINASGYFTAILIGFLSSILFSKLMLKDWTIKLPETVPPAIAQPFLRSEERRVGKECRSQL